MQVGFTMDFRNPNNEPWGQFWEDRLWLFKEAEAMGFDYLLVQEHFFTKDGYAPSASIFLTMLAERTSTARIGSYSIVLPLHQPARLAQELAVIDQLSGGRLDVTVGVGHRASEYVAMNMSPKTRPSRMEEGLEVLKKAWTGEEFTHEGRYYTLKNMTVTPPPFQQPHPPLWLAATSPAAAERAGRHGANLHGASVDPAMHEAYFEALDKAGFPRSEARVSNTWSMTITDEDPEVVWERNKSLYFERWDFYRQIRLEMGDADLSYGLEPSADAYRDFELIGSPAAVTETVKSLADTMPLTDIVHGGPAGGIPIRTEAYDSLKRFAEEVMPTFKSW